VSLERTNRAPDGLTDGRLCIATDTSGYSKQSDLDQAAIRRDLLDVLDGAAAAAGLRRPTWRRRSTGEFAELPIDEPARLVVDRFVRELDAELLRYNLPRPPKARMSMRVTVYCERLEVRAVPARAG
jgi:hypothetical protein